MDTPDPGADGRPADADHPADQDAWSRFADDRPQTDAESGEHAGQRWWGRQWIPLAIAAVVAMVILIVAVSWWSSSRSEPEEQLGVGAQASCWLDDGKVHCIDGPRAETVPDQTWSPEYSGTATALAVSDTQLCVGTDADEVRCTVLRGPQSEADGAAAEPPAVPLPARPVALAAGIGHACALVADGEVWCWGTGEDGRLGDGETERRSDPVRVRLDTPVRAITAGAKHTCALGEDGTVWCWGAGEDGRLGDGRAGSDHHRAEPVQVGIDGAAAAIAAGSRHTCAVLESGSAWCWGDGLFGQLGAGDGISAGVPTEVAGGHRFTRIAAGGFTTCGTDRDGQVWCWGDGGSGELGDRLGGPEHLSTAPVAVELPDTARTVAVGEGRGCAILSDKELACWGTGLGDGSAPAAAAVLDLD